MGVAMSVSNEKQNHLELLKTSLEIWNFLTKKAGLDTKNYDWHIVEEFCKQLSISLPCKDIKYELKRRNISPEVFLGAFLKTIQPYAQMMADLCSFFYLHGVKTTGKGMKILFDFGKGPKDLGFDLEHFRHILSRYTKIAQHLAIYRWNHDTLWILARIFGDYWQYTPKDLDAKDWLFNYSQNGELKLPLPILPVTEVEEIDMWLQRTWQVWATIILECRKYGLTRDDLKSYCNLRLREHPENAEELSKEDPEKITHMNEWNPRDLLFLDIDRWPESMLRGIFGFTEKLKAIEKSERINVAKDTIQQIQELFSKIPHWEGEREILVREFLELLDLPIWNKRHELYQTWILAQIDKTFDDYQHIIHDVNGELILKFSGTHVGTIETEKGRVHIWSELRSPLADPVGKGRKRNIQPDYSLTFEPVTVPSQTVIAIECKQYRKAKPKRFASALTDYARGRPNARILLVNYGDIPKKVLGLVKKNVRSRTFTIGNFMPGKLDEMQSFSEVLLQSLPKPIMKREVKKPHERMQFELIGVDISASMEKTLDEKTILELLQMVIDFSPHAKLLAIDTAVRSEWAKAETGLQELLDLPRNGETHLPRALSDYDLRTAVVLTDNDGFNQLSKTKNPPYLLMEVRTDKTVYFHYEG